MPRLEEHVPEDQRTRPARCRRLTWGGRQVGKAVMGRGPGRNMVYAKLLVAATADPDPQDLRNLCPDPLHVLLLPYRGEFG